jgi:predicted DNA-binding transcriptional regulator YafY
LEPFGETHGCYAIGFDEARGDIRTFRLDRIDAVALTADRFELPASFDPSRLFAEAWGVVWSGAEPQLVVLRATGEGAARVQERTWHPSQRLDPQPDGSCVVTFRVSAPDEMYRWILQWGADVEVLAPPGLRAAVAAEAARMGRRYAERDAGDAPRQLGPAPAPAPAPDRSTDSPSTP